VGLFLDYWKNEELNSLVFRHNMYYTLDKAYKDADGALLLSSLLLFFYLFVVFPVLFLHRHRVLLVRGQS
jgi:hypothetical protein